MPESHNHPLPPLPFTAATAIAVNTMNGEGEEEEEEEDHFDRLPDALIVVIFSKVSNAKYLLRCFAVCKRFASLLPQTDTVFLPLRCPKSPKPISAIFQSIVNLPLRILHRIVPVRLPPPTPPSSIAYDSPARAVVGIMKFKGVRSLRIEYQRPSNSACNSTYDRWMRSKAVIGARLDTAVFILTRDIPKLLQRFVGGPFLPIDALSHVVEEILLKEIKGRLILSLNHHEMAQMLIYHLPALSELVIGIKLIGKLCMGKEQIVELRNKCGCPGSSGVQSELSLSDVIGGNNGVVEVKMTLHPVPLSTGLVTKWAIVAVVKPQDDEEEIIVVERDVRLMLGACERDDDDDDDGGGDNTKAIDEVVNVVREKLVSDPHGRSSIKTHRLNLDED